MGYAGKARETGRPKRFAMLVAKRFFLETDGFYTEIAYHLNEFSLRDGHQIYTVVLSAETEEALKLPDVLQDPSLYPDLVVRVTGFSAYFASLSPKFRQLVVDRILDKRVS